MLRRRPLALALAAGIAAVAGWAACGGKQAASAGSDGGAGAGGAIAGSGGSGGTGGGDVGGSGANGGSAGSGGSPADAGPWGEAPVWKAIPGKAAGCTFERMVNAAQVRMFKWAPCSWTAGCQQAVWNTDALGPDPSFAANDGVSDDGATVRVALTMVNNVAIVADGEGMGLDALRVAGGGSQCLLVATSLWKNRFAVHVVDPGFHHFGGVLGDAGKMAAQPVAFTIPEPPPVGGTQGFVLGDSRWLWWWAPVDRFSTVSATDGSGFQIFAKAVGAVMEYSDPTTTGPLFLAEEFDQRDSGHVQGIIAYSDGVVPMKPYLVPPDPDNDYGEPAFANSDIGFMKGIHQTGVNDYDSVEIWAAPYNADPTQLQPELVGPFPGTSMDFLVGGWGRLGTVEGPIGGPFKVTIWNIATKTARRYPLPADHFPNPMLGVTRTHFWLGGASLKGDDPYLMRFEVQ